MSVKKKKIVHFVALKPIKRGSFEDFAVCLAKMVDPSYFSVHFVFHNQISTEIADFFHRQGLSYELRNMHGAWYMLSLVATVVKHRPWILHLHFLSFTLLSALLCRILGVEYLIMTIHDSRGYTVSSPTIEFAKKLRRRLTLLMVHKVVAVSNYVRHWLVNEAGIPGDKVVAIYNGIDTKRFSLPLDKGVEKEAIFGSPDYKVVIFIGQLIREKGIKIFIEVARQVLGQVPEALFIVVGDGPLRSQLESYVTQNNLNKQVRFLGMRNDTEKLLRASDVLVCPSLWKEAFGLINAEAMACGVPVVASRTGGIPEVVRHGETGYLFEPADERALAQYVIKILTDNSLRLRLGNKARRVAEKNFSLEKMAQGYCDFYVQLS